ncbi:MAG TPA: cyclopropane-fatty-acyl-phospholipid synthase family protein [Casimicrobiaceae bacterium]|nr:cyclopropane-fatty-acyl-phospholipid synthase family protein [Casimicrobiaceae bacterium]
MATTPEQARQAQRQRVQGRLDRMDGLLAPPHPGSASEPRQPGGMVGRRLAAIGGATEISFAVLFADGTIYRNRPDTAPAFTLRFNSAAAERRVVLFGHIGLLEGYFDGLIDIEGRFQLAARAAFDAGFDDDPNALVGLRNRWHEFRFSNRSIAQAKANARYHYGLGEPFYKLWLDRIGMMYTCAYWKEGTTTVEQAQQNKMDHVCRKVQLKAGETFVDVGCGWGGLLFHAWEKYGALGTGINTTTEQVNELRAEIARRGLTDKIKLVECDFREIPGQYDKMLSIGTLEHAGRDQLFEVIRAHADTLKPGGLGVIHFIGHVGTFQTEFYIRKHIFPGGWIPSLTEAMNAMERCGLEVLDVENLRRHYALTLDAWGERFEANWKTIHAMDPKRFDESFYRKWRTYLWACAEMFRARKGHTHLFQVLVSKGNIGGNYPMSRTFLYRAES